MRKRVIEKPKEKTLEQRIKALEKEVTKLKSKEKKDG